jgi:hypothetical protein
MELQWNLCPFCGNQHVDLYQAGPPLIPEANFDQDPEPEYEMSSNNHSKEFILESDLEETQEPPTSDLEDLETAEE